MIHHIASDPVGAAAERLIAAAEVAPPGSPSRIKVEHEGAES